MKIAIISDVHNNEVNLKKVLNYCWENKIEVIICCGDLASKEILDFMNDNFAGKMYLTFGNADYDDLTDLWTGSSKPRTPGSDEKVIYRNTFLYKDFGEAIADNKVIAFVHFPDKAKSLARTGRYAFVFYGHTHQPWEMMIGKCKLLNPGTTGGEIYPPTFAVWNTATDKFELIRIHPLK